MENSHEISIFWIVIMTMLSGGIVGGSVSYFFDPLPLPSKEDMGTESASTRTKSFSKHPPYFLRCLAVGIGAALLVPVFLFLTQSQLLNDVMSVNLFSESPTPVALKLTEEKRSMAADTLGTLLQTTAVELPTQTLTSAKLGMDGKEVKKKKQDASLIIFFGLCVLVAISGFRFIPTVTDRFLQLERKTERLDVVTNAVVEEVKKKEIEIESNKKQIEVTQQSTESQDDWIKEFIRGGLQSPVQKVHDFDIRVEPLADLTPITKIKSRDELIEEHLAMPEKFPEDNDFQKGRWGGNADSSHYRLSALVEPIDKHGKYCTVTFTVTSKNPEIHELTGEVVFLTHPSFVNAKTVVRVEQGRARLKLWSYGVFTVGAVTDDLEIMELDLSNVVKNDPRISKEFKHS